MRKTKPLLSSKTALVLGAWIAYALAFMPLYGRMGAVVPALAILPVIVTAWFWGMRTGLFVGLLALPLNALLITLAGGNGWGMMGHGAGLLGSFLVALTGFIVGLLRDMREQVRLGLTERQQRRELEALQEISLAISAQLELDKLLQNVVEQGCRLLDVGLGGVYLVDETRGDLELVVSHGYTRDYTGTRPAPGKGLCGKVLQSGEPLVVDDYSHWEGRSPDWEAEPLTAILGVPLKHGEQITGVLEFAEGSRARRFDEHDLWLATLFASQAAIAIENARSYEMERQARQVAESLREATATLVSSLEPDQVLDRILE